ncbi:hypothetical protein [Subsaximicrobium wynnwilliamsii]|nr:hypothetical protein [Subsaximicrobium wynnwilliamsii]
MGHKCDNGNGIPVGKTSISTLRYYYGSLRQSYAYFYLGQNYPK